jgi:hypothetical protein
MQAALLLVFSLLILIIILNYVYRVNDGFTNPTGEPQSSFILDRLKQYGNLGVSMITADTVGSLGNSANNLTATTPINSVNDTPLNTEDTGLFAITKTCEAIQTMDCSAFDDPKFSLNCGLCLDGLAAKNSSNAPIPGGGLVLLAEDKQNATDKNKSNFMPSYVATVGFCPAGKLVSTKEECIKLQRQLVCGRNKSFDQPGCAQCYTSGTFSVVDPSTSPGIISNYGTLSLIGSGSLIIQEEGFDEVKVTLSTGTTYDHDLRSKEGDKIRLVVTPSSTSSPIFIAGVLSGQTFSGEFSKDLRSIIYTDEVSGRSPRSSGMTTVNDGPATKMSPVYGQKSMSLRATVPFSFVDPNSDEASLCRDGPYSTLPTSASQDPCYKPGSGPGKFSLECLQNIWSSNGCTNNGTAYPSNTSTASSLMSKRDGSLRSLNDIADFVYNNALITSTGIDKNGRKQLPANWSAASMFCTGVPISSPCDGPTKATGPLSAECISYLWQNAGANQNIGPTYNGYGTSLITDSTDPQYCTAKGTLSPTDINGVNKPEVIAWWQTKGGVDAVKKIMSDTYAAANAQISSDDERMPYIRQCYGELTLADRPLPAPQPMDDCPASTTSLIKSIFKPKRDNMLNSSFSISPDYTIVMNITPRGVVNEWSSLIHMTTGKDQFEYGSRVLAIFFYPGYVSKLAIHIDHSSSPGWAARETDTKGLDLPLTIGKKSQLVINCNGSKITISVDGTVYGNFTREGLRYRGKVKVYASSPWYPPANCLITSLCYGRALSTIVPAVVSSNTTVIAIISRAMIYSNDGGNNWKPCGENAFPSSLESRVYFILNNGSQWLAGGPSSSGTRLAVSKDGINWTEVASMVNRGATWSSYYSGVWTGDSWIIMELLLPSYQTKALYSYDGISWSEMQIGVNSYVTEIAAGKSTLVAVCGGIKRGANPANHAIYYSLDNGDSWDFAPNVDDYFQGDANLQCVGFNGTYFVAGGCSTAAGYPPIMLYSSNGINWTKANIPAGVKGRIWSAKSNGTMWVSSAGTDGLLYSTDTVNWTRSYQPEIVQGATWPNGSPHGIKWTGSEWYAGCNNGVVSSPDGINWKIAPVSKLINAHVDALG